MSVYKEKQQNKEEQETRRKAERKTVWKRTALKVNTLSTITNIKPKEKNSSSDVHDDLSTYINHTRVMLNMADINI